MTPTSDYRLVQSKQTPLYLGDQGDTSHEKLKIKIFLERVKLILSQALMKFLSENLKGNCIVTFIDISESEKNLLNQYYD